MNNLEFYQVDNFYDTCDNCDTWIEFNLKEEASKKYIITDYDVTINTNHIKEEWKENSKHINNCVYCEWWIKYTPIEFQGCAGYCSIHKTDTLVNCSFEKDFKHKVM